MSEEDPRGQMAAAEAQSSTGDDRGGSGKPLRSFLLLAAGQVIGQVIGFAVLVLVAREVGSAGLGVYQFSASIILYFSLATNLGITTLAVREVAADRGRANRVAGEVLTLRLALAIGLAAVVLLLAPAISPTDHSRILLDILAIKLIIDALSFDWVLQAYERLGRVAAATLLGQVIYGVVTPLVITSGFQGVVNYTITNLVGTAVAMIAVGILTVRLIGMPTLKFGGMDLLDRGKRSIPFALSLVAIQVYYTSDFIILGYLEGSNAVGLYSVAYRLPQAVIGLGALWFAAFFPYVARRGIEARESLRVDVGKATTFGAIAALALVAGTAPIATQLLRDVFGADFAPGGTAFILLMANAAVVVVGVSFGNVLLAVGDERRYAVGVSIGAGLNIVLNVVLIPQMGIEGAAIATLGAEILVLAYMIRRSDVLIGRPAIEWMRIARGAVAALLTAGLLFVLQDVVWAPCAAVIGAIFFVGAALLLRAIAVDELAIWRRAT